MKKSFSNLFTPKRHKSLDSTPHLLSGKDVEEYFEGVRASTDQDGIILSEHLKLSTTTDPNGTMDPDMRRAFNNNILVFAGSGAGVERSFISPNLDDARHNFVVTDLDGEMYAKHAKALAAQGYNVRCVNLVNPQESDFYNPLLYIRSEKDAFILTNTIMKGTSIEQHNGDPFWEKAENLLLCSLLLYVWHTAADPKDRTFNSVMKLLEEAEQDEDVVTKTAPLDLKFERLEAVDPNNLAVTLYKKFKLAAGKTRRNIVVSLFQRLKMFKLSETEQLLSDDTLHLEYFGNTPNVLFITVPCCNSTLNVICNMLYSQIISTLQDIAESCKATHLLPRHVQFIMQDFTHVGVIPDIWTYLSVSRKYNMSFSLITGSINNIKAVYKDDWDIIMASCRTVLYFGTSDMDTNRYFSGLCGKRVPNTLQPTIDTHIIKKQRVTIDTRLCDIISSDDLQMLPITHCVANVHGHFPVYDKKATSAAIPMDNNEPGTAQDVQKEDTSRTIPLFKRVELDKQAFFTGKPAVTDSVILTKISDSHSKELKSALDSSKKKNDRF